MFRGCGIDIKLFEINYQNRIAGFVAFGEDQITLFRPIEKIYCFGVKLGELLRRVSANWLLPNV
jgi:hypothetical protein